MFDAINCPKPDEFGYFCHPDIPVSVPDVRPWLQENGYACQTVDMDTDAPELSDAYHELEDVAAATRWVPTPPDGGPWILVAKYDTEDGPCSLFVRALTPLDSVRALVKLQTQEINRQRDEENKCFGTAVDAFDDKAAKNGGMPYGTYGGMD